MAPPLVDTSSFISILLGSFMDKISKGRRSWNMSRIRAKDTKPEMLVRCLLHRAGYRFRLHNRRLPGKPDIVLAKYQTVVFVHGCYWHRHPNCREAAIPRTNQDYWLPKFERTVQRDQKAQTALRGKGWNVIVLWECDLEQTDPDELLSQLNRAIRSGRSRFFPLVGTFGQKG